MTILYSVVSRGTTILARHATCTGNFDEVTEQILRQIPPEDSKLTYSHDTYLFHYVSENTIIYMCITDNEFERSRAFHFLNVIKERFQSLYGNRALTAMAYSLNSEFSRVLANEMKFYSSDHGADKIARVHGQLDELTEIMVKNIDNVVARGEKLELLIDMADNLTRHSVSFRQTSRTLARALFWKNVKFYMILALICLVILYILVSIVCGGFAWQTCVR